jgi:hypothetical protein
MLHRHSALRTAIYRMQVLICAQRVSRRGIPMESSGIDTVNLEVN